MWTQFTGREVDGPVGVHELTLWCIRGQCETTLLTLNQCIGDVFYPKIEQASTADGSLKIETVSENALSVRPGVLLYRFDYETIVNDELAERMGLSSNLFFRQLTGFSGSAQKNSAILGQGRLARAGVKRPRVFT